MRYLKVLCLVGVLAGLMVTVGGTGSATAAKFCAPGSPEDAKCGAGKKKKPYTGVIVWEHVGWVLTTNITNVTCKSSALSMEFGSSEGTPITGQVTAMSASNDCTTTSGTSCTVTSVNLPYEASVESSTLTISDEAGVGFKVVCGVLVNCTFTTKSAELAVSNGSSAEISATEMTLQRSGGFCPSIAKWDPLYVAVLPVGLTIV